MRNFLGLLGIFYIGFFFLTYFLVGYLHFYQSLMYNLKFDILKITKLSAILPLPIVILCTVIFSYLSNKKDKSGENRKK